MNIRNFLIRFIGGAAALFGTVVAFAQIDNNSTGVALDQGTGIQNILGTISSIFAVIIPILVTLAVIYVIWGVIKYATSSDDEAQVMARQTILKGIIALFVIVSIWGLVAVLNRTFDIEQSGSNIGACQPVWSPGTQTFITPPQCL